MNDAVKALIEAAIALAWSESGTAATLHGDPDAAILHEPWPEMDALCVALDEAAPGWREGASRDE